MVRPSMMGTLAPQKKEAAFSTQEERPSFRAAVPTQAWEGFHANGKSCGPRSFWRAGEQGRRARTPLRAQRTSPDDPHRRPPLKFDESESQRQPSREKHERGRRAPAQLTYGARKPPL